MALAEDRVGKSDALSLGLVESPSLLEYEQQQHSDDDSIALLNDDPDGFELVIHSPSNTSENIADLLHSLADQSTRAEILKNVQQLVEENEKSKDLLSQTYEALKQRELDDSQRRKQWETMEVRLRDMEIQRERNEEVKMDLQDKINQSCQQVDLLKTEITDLKTLSDMKSEAVEKYEIEVEQLRNQIKKTEQEKADLLIINNDLMLQVNSVGRDFSIVSVGESAGGDPGHTSQASEIKLQISTLQTQVEELRQQKEQTEQLNTDLREQLKSAEDRCRKAEQEIETLTEVVHQNVASNLEIEAAKMEAQQRETAINQQIISLQRERSHLSNKVEDLLAGQNKNCENNINTMAIQLIQKDDDLQRKDSQILKLQEDIKNCEARICELEQKQRQYELDIKELKEKKNKYKNFYHEHQNCSDNDVHRKYMNASGGAENGTTEMIPQPVASETMEVCPVCQLDFADKDGHYIERHVNDCLDEDERKKRRENNVEV